MSDSGEMWCSIWAIIYKLMSQQQMNWMKIICSPHVNARNLLCPLHQYMRIIIPLYIDYMSWTSNYIMRPYICLSLCSGKSWAHYGLYRDMTQVSAISKLSLLHTLVRVSAHSTAGCERLSRRFDWGVCVCACPSSWPCGPRARHQPHLILRAVARVGRQQVLLRLLAARRHHRVAQGHPGGDGGSR